MARVPGYGEASGYVNAAGRWMQLSYAQRLEDYHLDLVFAGQDRGFYIDVGAGHPVADNVSFWFYLKGWRGLVVEPQRALADIYPHVRPRDIAVCSLLGRHVGEMDFHIVDRLHGFSTTVEANAKAASNFGVGYVTERRPVTTLAALVAKHGVTQVDFLKIDVEGAEADVFAGTDWSLVRPRVVVAEAVGPGDIADAWTGWEPLLLAQGYTFAFFDSLNRFYVADEAADLRKRFPSKPAQWDRVQHLRDFGHAAELPDHPDHVLASRLVAGFLAALPSLDHDTLAGLLMRGPGFAGPDRTDDMVSLLFGSAEYPGPSPDVAAVVDPIEACLRLMDSDRFRATLGRIASTYDGGHPMGD